MAENIVELTQVLEKTAECVVELDNRDAPAVEPVKMDGPAGLVLHVLYWSGNCAIGFCAGWLIGDAAIRLKKRLPF
jgi:hypothetical protein